MQRPGRRKDGCATFWRSDRLELLPGPPHPAPVPPCSPKTVVEGVRRGLWRVSSSGCNNAVRTSGCPEPGPAGDAGTRRSSSSGRQPPQQQQREPQHPEHGQAHDSVTVFDGVYRLGFSEMALDDNVALIVRLTPRCVLNVNVWGHHQGQDCQGDLLACLLMRLTAWGSARWLWTNTLCSLCG